MRLTLLAEQSTGIVLNRVCLYLANMYGTYSLLGSVLNAATSINSLHFHKNLQGSHI